MRDLKLGSLQLKCEIVLFSFSFFGSIPHSIEYSSNPCKIGQVHDPNVVLSFNLFLYCDCLGLYESNYCNIADCAGVGSRSHLSHTKT
jgi:hypothetical protein